MTKKQVKSYAKINITLDAVRKREDGYHDLKMIMQSVSLYDRVTIETKESGITVKSNLKYVPDNEDNLGYKAAKLFFEESGINGGADIYIEKHIPVAAGLAGGSGNAAAVLKGLNDLYGNPFDMEKLMEIGLKIGSDIPFCLVGGTRLAQGRGEILEKITPPLKAYFVLATPPFGVSTKKIFSALRADKIEERPDTDGVIEEIKNRNVQGVAVRMYNVLEPVANIIAVKKLKEKMLDLGALGSVMSGSGPTVIGMFRDEKSAKKAKMALRKGRCLVYDVRTVDKGVE